MLTELTSPQSEEPTFRSLIRCFGMVRRVMHPFFRRYGISESQWGVLRVLSRSDPGGLRVGDLGERLLVRPPSVTGVVSRLEKMGLVARSLVAEDQRAKQVKLTASGRALLLRIRQGHAQYIKDVLAPLSKEEQERLRALLERLSSHMEEMADGRQAGAKEQA